MRVVVFRPKYEDKQVLGVGMILDDTRLLSTFKTLELGWKLNANNESCIPVNSEPFTNWLGDVVTPADEYILRFEKSHKFKMKLWEIYGVHGRAECKFHTANYFRQLNGCVAPGDMHLDIDKDGYRDVRNSRNTLLNKIHAILPQDQEHTLVIKHVAYPNVI